MQSAPRPHSRSCGTSFCAAHLRPFRRRIVCFLVIVSTPHPLPQLRLTLLPPEQADDQDASAIDSKQRADGIELGGENLKDYQGKRELPDRCADVGALEGALCRPDLNQLFAG